MMNDNTNAAKLGSSNQASEPWMETATPGKFTDFQTPVFTVVEKIVSKPENAHHPFTTKWKKLCRVPKNPMSATISWRSLKGLLQLSDIFDYKNYIQQCPNIAEYINGIEVYMDSI
jgi:hypothetical protein